MQHLIVVQVMRELNSLTITRGNGNDIELRDSYSGDGISLTGQKRILYRA